MKKLLVFLKDYKKESVLAPTFKMLEAIFELLVPLAVTAIIDEGINKGNTSVVWRACGFMLLLGVVGLISALCAQFFAARAAVGFATKVRSALFSKIQSFSYSVTDKLGTSTLITRLTSDINSAQTGVNMFLRLFMRSPFIVFGAMICAMLIDFWLGLIFAGVIVILAVIVFGIMLINIKLHKKTQARLDGVVSKVRGNYGGTRVVRAFNKEDEEIEEFDKRIDSLNKLQLFSGKISALMNPLTYAIINLAVILLIRNGALTVEANGITQGELIALYNYMSQILVELIKLASLIITLNKAAASASRISSILDTPSDIDHKVSKPSLETDKTVVFENVSFRYDTEGEGEAALKDISFTARRGDTIGIIGGTGSGKSTLANLIPGFYHATEGNIFINGKNASLLSADELEASFAIVPQKATLFSGSIRSNLLWGNKNADEDELWSALELACAKDFVEEKAGGLDEEVLQGGKNFSGGQRQRLTIARALVRRPEILILDDSASALDYATESALRKNIASLDYDPTVFIVSQRASSIMHADLIIVLEDGEAVGMGKHEELLETCEVYREIYDSQFSKGGESK
ncbi:MAG: ABC transporter ATP-binding protein [Clostridia bacterium]|nr:ABC transporter ATP-binding protein [Clostridia bacterium]